MKRGGGGASLLRKMRKRGSKRGWRQTRSLVARESWGAGYGWELTAIITGASSLTSSGFDAGVNKMPASSLNAFWISTAYDGAFWASRTIMNAPGTEKDR